jgi:hypothetical protein
MMKHLPDYFDKVRAFYAADKRYDLNFKTPGNDGSEVKSGDEMIDLYKSFCKGIHPTLVFFPQSHYSM